MSVAALTPEQKAIINSGIPRFNIEEYSICSGGAGIVNGSIDRFLQVLAFQESTGSPTAEAGGGSTASGKYQYVNGTWRSSATTYYGPANAYPRARDAPEAVQDAVAYLEYTKKFKDLNNDIFRLAISHFLPAALTNESLLDVVPGGNVITPRQYADKLVANMGTDIGNNIALHYTEAPEFQTWLARVGGAAAQVNSGATGNAGATGSTCADSLTGGSVVSLAQAEFAAWESGGKSDPTLYGGGPGVAWCAYFVSWIFERAGKPLEGGPIASVDGITALARQKDWYHAKGEAGFTPQPGDVIIYDNGLNPYPSHVNFVISYDGATRLITTIGGNEHNSVQQRTIAPDNPSITGFMRVP